MNRLQNLSIYTHMFILSKMFMMLDKNQNRTNFDADQYLTFFTFFILKRPKLVIQILLLQLLVMSFWMRGSLLKLWVRESIYSLL